MARFVQIFIMIVFIFISHAANATEKRCGWLANPTPANLWLIDRDGSWIISIQGGYHVAEASLDSLPQVNENEFVRTNVNYGYSCVCLDVVVDKVSMRITQIVSGQNLLLKKCLEDRALPKL